MRVPKVYVFNSESDRELTVKLPNGMAQADPDLKFQSDYFALSLYTYLVLFFFSIIGERLSKASLPERAREGSGQNIPRCFYWPLFLSPARSTEFEEKIEGLWTGYFELGGFYLKITPTHQFERIGILDK